MKYIHLLILLMPAFVFSGCSYNSLNTNRVSMIYDDMVFTASMSPLDLSILSIEDRNPQFFSIKKVKTIKMNSFPIEIDWDIYIEMADGKKCHVSEFMKESTAKNYATKVIENDGSFTYEEWEVIYILGERWKVAYDQVGNLLYFSNYFSESTKNITAVWDSELKKRYFLPLKMQEIKELFGEPDQIKEARLLY